MYITDTSRPDAPNPCWLLRESYRENGQVKSRTLANLSHCPKDEIDAMKLALKHKGKLQELGVLEQDLTLQQGLSVGGVATVLQVAQRLGIEKALGSTTDGKLALWQVIARVLDQGSRLSAVRLAQTHASCELLSITEDFTEDTLYANLAWIAKKQSQIEGKLFNLRRSSVPDLFLYDVTSSYLEGSCNAFAAFGYNRDRKRGKQQIVVGLLCDETGTPVSVEVFPGNTVDTETFGAQIEKVKERFGSDRVTFVGDRGMIKGPQQKGILDNHCHYITAITKPQIETLLKRDVIQFSLFDSTVAEVKGDDCRYILRRNPVRAEEMAASRRSKLAAVEALVQAQNTYLAEHPRAEVAVAARKITDKMAKLRVNEFLAAEIHCRKIILHLDDETLFEVQKLDGCYVLTTDLPPEVPPQVIHDRYKDLTLVEQAFRTSKTTFLELRPWHVRTESSTRGHALVVMLAYLIVQELQRCWADLELTVEEGLDLLKQHCSQQVFVKGELKFSTVPEPSLQGRQLLKRAQVILPKVLPRRQANVVTRKKLVERRNI